MLSIQLLIIVVLKPAGKFFLQEFVPWAKYRYRRYKLHSAVSIEKPRNETAEIERQSILPDDHNVMREYTDKASATITVASYPRCLSCHTGVLTCIFAAARGVLVAVSRSSCTGTLRSLEPPCRWHR